MLRVWHLLVVPVRCFRDLPLPGEVAIHLIPTLRLVFLMESKVSIRCGTVLESVAVEVLAEGPLKPIDVNNELA